MSKFRSDQKSQILHWVNNSFLNDSTCRDLVNNLTNENCSDFIRECNKYLFELTNQNKYLSILVKKYIHKHPQYKDSYDSILSSIYEMHEWNYGSGINGFMWVIGSMSKIDKLYQNYQKKIDDYSKLEQLKIQEELRKQETINAYNTRVEAYYERQYERSVEQLPIYRFFKDSRELSKITEKIWEIPANMRFEDGSYYVNGIGYNDY
jgi:hypothetical protein